MEERLSINSPIKPSLNTLFKNRDVRDLAWVISSPPLVAGYFNQTRWWNHKECLKEFEDCLPELKLLDKNPVPLTTHLDQLKSKRLGMRFESLISFWLDNVSPNFTLLGQNIQLFELINKNSDNSRRTLGEVDFIIEENHSKKIIHLEVAVKFYLGIADLEDPYRWFGTNLDDQLGKKLDHLKSHQTQLLSKYPEKTPYQVDETHCLLKGRLFYPLDENTSPLGVTENHLRGRWLRDGDSVNNDIGKENSQAIHSLVALQKNEWLAELTATDIEERTIQREFSPLDRSQCYSSVVDDKNKEKNKKIELERVFHLPKSFQFPSSSIDK